MGIETSWSSNRTLSAHPGRAACSVVRRPDWTVPVVAPPTGPRAGSPQARSQCPLGTLLSVQTKYLTMPSSTRAPRPGRRRSRRRSRAHRCRRGRRPRAPRRSRRGRHLVHLPAATVVAPVAGRGRGDAGLRAEEVVDRVPALRRSARAGRGRSAWRPCGRARGRRRSRGRRPPPPGPSRSAQRASGRASDDGDGAECLVVHRFPRFPATPVVGLYRVNRRGCRGP